jgi:hypothetical protein
MFYFSKKYCEDTPERLSVIEFVSGILPRVASLISIFFRGLFVFLFWIIALPFWTSWCLANTTRYLLGDDVQFNTFDTFTSILDPLAYWWNGVIACAFIVMCSLGVLESVRFVLIEIDRTMADVEADIEAEVEAEIEEEEEEKQEEEEEEEAVVDERRWEWPDHQPEGRTQGTYVGAEEGRSEGGHHYNHHSSTDVVGNDLDLDESINSSSDTSWRTEVSNIEQVEEERGMRVDQQEEEEEAENVIENHHEPRDHQHEQPDGNQHQHVDDLLRDQDAIVIDLGVVLMDSMWKTVSRSVGFALYNFFFIQSAVLLPTLLGRIAIYFIGMEAYLRGEGKKLMDFVEMEDVGSTILSADNHSSVPEGLDGNTDTVPDREQPFDKEMYISRIVVGVEFLLGWSFLIELLVAALVIKLIMKFNNTRERGSTSGWQSLNSTRIWAKLSFFSQEVQKWTKAAVFIGLELTIIPQTIGWVIDIITLKAFDTTAAERLAFFHDKPLIGGIIHFMVGFFFINHVGVFTLELRRVLKENVLVKILPEQSVFGDEYAFDVFGDQPVSILVQRVLLILFYCIPAMLVMIMLPVTFGHHFCPCAEPFQLYFNELYYDIQLPLELLVFQFLLPFLAQKISHRQSIRFFVSRYVVHACGVLGLEELLDEEVAAGVLRREGERGNDIMRRVMVVDLREEHAGGDDEEELEVNGDEADEVVFPDNDAGDDVGGIPFSRGLEEEEEEGGGSPLIPPEDYMHPSGAGVEGRASLRQKRGKRAVVETAKGLVLLGVGLFLLFLGCSWLIHVPVIAGRCILKYLG